jgi:hypothetical protein
MDAQIDGLGIEELCDRYSIKKAQFYNRKNSLNLEFEIPAGSRKAIANADQIALLDELDSYLKAGGQIEQFAISKGIEESTRPSSQSSNGLSIRESTDLQGMMILAEAIASGLAPQNKIAQLRERIGFLKELCDQQIPIPSSDLKMVLDRRSLGKVVFAYGFQAVRIGKQSGESLWQIHRVAKLSPNLSSED